jgi:phospholipid transport system transporter-binding protein
MNSSLSQSARSHSADPDTLALSGALTFANAAQVFEQTDRALQSGTQTRLDLSAVTRADSAGLACVLALLARASRSGRPLRVSNIPESLRALAEVCDARDLLAEV